MGATIKQNSMVNMESDLDRRWYYMFLFIPAGYLMLFIVFTGFFSTRISSDVPVEFVEIVSSTENDYFYGFLWTFASCVIVYLFSYRRRCTSILTMFIVEGISLFVKFAYKIPDLYQMVENIQNLQNYGDVHSNLLISYYKFALFSSFFSLFLTVLWVSFCYKLRKVNLKKKRSLIRNREIVKAYVDKMKLIYTSIELDEFYSNSVSVNPSFKDFFTQEYQIKKQELESLKGATTSS